MKPSRLFQWNPRRFKPLKLMLLASLLLLSCFVFIQTRDQVQSMDASSLVVLLGVQDSGALNAQMQPTPPNRAYEKARNETPSLWVELNEYPYQFIIPNEKRCTNANGKSEEVHLLFIVKSSALNFERRMTIRKTWGIENRFPGIVIRRVFNLGRIMNDSVVQQKVLAEQIQNGDIVQSDFVDNYYNNTIKTMMGMRWTLEYCPTAKFIMFVDDDMYVSPRNVIRFLNQPTNFPKFYLKKNDSAELVAPAELSSDFYVGHTMVNFAPHREKNSKWYISPEDYPLDKYPTFVLAGAFIMSFQTLQKMYAASKHTKHLRFDDVYLGLVARTAGIVLLHNDRFHNWKLPTSYRFALSAHLYGDTKKLETIWKKQKYLNNV